MNTIRELSPIDLYRLTSIRSMMSDDAAHTKDNLGVYQPTRTAMRLYLRQWVNPRITQRQQGWIYTGENGLQGFVSVRGRMESYSWEIDHLLLLRDKGNSICYDLLHTVANESRSAEARRIFLRLAANDPLIHHVEQAGFTRYLRERLYQLNVRPQGDIVSAPSRFTVRPVHKSDEYRLFELYNAVYPDSIRCIEGITFAEWKEVHGSLSCQRRKKEFVIECNGNIIAQLKVISQGKSGQFELICDPKEDVKEILTFTTTYLSGYSIVRCLVPECNAALISLLQNYDFTQIAEYDVLANFSAIRVQKSQLMPVRI